MSQASFDFPPAGWHSGGTAVLAAPGVRRAAPDGATLDSAAELEAVGFSIGRDHALHRVAPAANTLVDGHPVRAGFESGRSCFGARTLRATPAVRHWLALRMHAWNQGIGFDACHVTPHLLERLHAGVCPVTRRALAAFGQACGPAAKREEPAVLRVDGRLGYVPGNLAVVSAPVITALAGRGFHEVVEVVRALEASGEPERSGLSLAAWSRLAVLLSLRAPLPHAEAARLPLLVTPPPRVPLVNPAQALQLMLTTQLCQPGYARRLAELAARVPAAGARQALQVFMHTLLARRVGLGAQADAATLRRGLEDAWRHPLVNQRWQAFATGLTPAACERLAEQGVVAQGPGPRGQAAARRLSVVPC